MDKRAQSLGLGWARKAHSFHTLLASFCPRPRTQTRQTGHSQDAKRNSLQGAETQGQGPVPSAFLSHPPSGCLGCFPQVL